MDILLDKGLQLDEDQLKLALRQIGKEFIMEARKLLNQPDLATDDSLPHTETGTLAKSLKARIKTKKGSIWLSVVADTRYATALFAGSTRTDKNGIAVKVRGRPLFDVVMEKIAPRMSTIIADVAKLKSA